MLSTVGHLKAAMSHESMSSLTVITAMYIIIYTYMYVSSIIDGGHFLMTSTQ